MNFKYLFLIVLCALLLFAATLLFDKLEFLFSTSFALLCCSMGVLIGQYIKRRHAVDISKKKFALSIFFLFLTIGACILVKNLVPNPTTGNVLVSVIAIVGGISTMLFLLGGGEAKKCV